MVKKISTLALVGLLTLPAMAFAGAGGAAGTSDMQAQIDALTKQLNEMKAQMEKIKAVKPAPAVVAAPAPATDYSDRISALEDRAEKWDLSSRIQLSGDFRSRLDAVTADTPAHFEALNVARGMYQFSDVFSNFNTAFGTLLTGPQQAALMGASLGSLFAGTAPADAMTGMGILMGQANLAPMFAVMPSLVANDPTQTMGAVATSFGGLFGTPGTLNAQNVVAFMKTLSPADRRAAFVALGTQGYLANPAITPSQDYDNDTIWTNRFRLDLRAKALENVEFKGRLAMYKAWGMQNNPADYSYNNGMGGGPFALAGYMSDFDGASTRNPNDSILRVDRAYVNWNAIGGSPFWFSIGRRPTTDGPPQNLKLGSDERMATPAAVMDWPFDGLTIGYAYDSLFGLTDAPGRIRFCYGRGFESGPDSDRNRTLNDVDFAGLSWDIYKKGNRFLYLQSYGAFNVFNVPDSVTFANPLEYAAWEYNRQAFGTNTYDPLDPSNDLVLGRANLGNIYHTTAVYMDKYQKLNYFLTGAWSRTDVKDQVDEMGTSLLGEWWNEPKNHSGYHFHAGVRYDLDDMGLKLGAEYNYGSKYWISMSPGHDDMYQSKLATRGNVYEIYGIYDIPGGEAVSKYGKAWMRLGYQHFDYKYTGSGFWLGEPKSIDELANDPFNAQFYTPVDKMDQIYLTFEASF